MVMTETASAITLIIGMCSAITFMAYRIISYNKWKKKNNPYVGIATSSASTGQFVGVAMPSPVSITKPDPITNPDMYY